MTSPERGAALTVLVTGASGLLGTHLLARPAAAGYRIRAMSRSAGGRSTTSPGRPDDHPVAVGPAPSWVSADLVTGQGLDAAVQGVDVIVHAASAAQGDTRRTDVEGTARLLAAAHRSGVQHILYISIVGADRIPLRYYGYKVAAEELVQQSGTPWTILRGTQFFPFLDRICHALTRLPVCLVPAGWLVQPIDVGEFADVVWNAVAAGPTGRAPDAGGPEILSLEAIVRTWMEARGRRKPTFAIPVPGRISAAMRSGSATTPTSRVGRGRWAEWLGGRNGKS